MIVRGRSWAVRISKDCVLRAELEFGLKTPEGAIRDLGAISMESKGIYHQGDCVQISYRDLGRFGTKLKFCAHRALSLNIQTARICIQTTKWAVTVPWQA